MNRLSRHEGHSASGGAVTIVFTVAKCNLSDCCSAGGNNNPCRWQTVPGNTYSWEIYCDTNANFAAVPGDCPTTFATFSGSRTGASVRILWLQPGTFFFKVTARNEAGCTMNLKIGKVQC